MRGADVDLSIVVVNFDSAHFLAPLVESIGAQNWSVEGRVGTWELTIVDNASRGPDRSVAAPLLEDPRIRWIQNTVNAGYGQANNQGFAVSRGRFHMILNPDARFLPGCFHALIKALETIPDADVVGPLAYMDPDAQCMMPPNEMPTPELFERQTMALTDLDAARRNLAERTRFARDYWCAQEPVPMPMLSGSCLVFERDLFAHERPFDPGYPLYYEDTDLFMRLNRRGKKLYHVPRAKMLHYWSQSADRYARGAERRCDISARRFYRKWFGEDGVATYERNRAAATAARDAGVMTSPIEFEPLEVGADPPVFPVGSASRRWFVEFAGNPIFTLAVGMFPEEGADHVVVNPTMWAQLGPGRYWIRIVDEDSLETLRAWVIEKPRP